MRGLAPRNLALAEAEGAEQRAGRRVGCAEIKVVSQTWGEAKTPGSRGRRGQGLGDSPGNPPGPLLEVGWNCGAAFRK
jgi:hypothetical protein